MMFVIVARVVNAFVRFADQVRRVDACRTAAYKPRSRRAGARLAMVRRRSFFETPERKARAMKIRNSLKTAKLREKGCRVVRRRGRVYVINKKQPRFKARQG